MPHPAINPVTPMGQTIWFATFGAHSGSSLATYAATGFLANPVRPDFRARWISKTNLPRE